jgi:hypothetical protein
VSENGSGLPRVVASSVIRSAHQGESHGGVYLVDLASGEAEQVIDWDDSSISWEGRGADRGLRGIAFHGDEVYLAASDEIFAYDRDFRLLRSFRNAYLKHCHEICIAGGRLYATSTGFDSLLEYDLAEREWVRGYTLRFGELQRIGKRLGLTPRPPLRSFDPRRDGGPVPGDSAHINSVSWRDGAVYVCGTRLRRLLVLEEGRLRSHASVPPGTHNAQPYGEHVLVNHTASNRICVLDRRAKVVDSYAIPTYAEDELVNAELDRSLARQGFGRGLALLPGGLLVGGSSPATISVYRPGSELPLRSVNLTMDVRNAIHGLELWPFGPAGRARSLAAGAEAP